MRSAHRAAAAVAMSLLLSLGLAACGESGGEADVKPAGDPTSPSSRAASAPSSASPTASASAATVARSGLEDQAPVETARSWAAAVATEVNQKSTSHAQTRAFTTSRGARTLPKTYTGDYGLQYPGPLPFTPISVKLDGRRAEVPACVQGGGWAIDKTGFAPQRESVSAVTFLLKKRGGRWKLDAITGRQQSCDAVTVKGYSR